VTIHSKGPGGGYWHYYVLLAGGIAFVVAALATNYFGLG